MPLNPTQAAILGLLHDGPMIGGELNAMASKWVSPYWNMTRSQIYRELPTLAEKGHIQPAKEYGPRLSLQYKITAAGKRAFQAWLKEDPSPDLLRSEAILRISFGALHKGDGLQDLLNWMRNHHELKVDEIASVLAEANDDGMDYDVAALRFAIMYHQMIIGWLETVELPDAD